MKDRDISRRRFFKSSATLGAALAVSGVSAFDAKPKACQPPAEKKTFNIVHRREEDKHQIKNYRPLGNLGWKVSDISFGTVGFSDPAVLKYALDCGINYIDTAYTYGNGAAEIAIGEVIKDRRKDVFLTTKVNGAAFKADDLRKALMESLDTSLERLQTDHVDCIMIHGGSPEQVTRDEVFDFFEKAKKDGKVNYLGTSGHDASVAEAIEAAVKTGQYSVVMPAFGYYTEQKNAEYLAEAAKKGLAVVAMKAMGAAYNAKVKDWERQNIKDRSAKYTYEFAQAAFSWVLSHEFVSCLVIGMRNMDHVSTYVPLSGSEHGSQQRKVLEYYGKLYERDYCRIGCGECLSACPHHVSIDDILRFDMYFDNYGMEKVGMEEYARLESHRRAIPCLGCDAPCETRCPYHVRIKQKLAIAHQHLTMSA
jgi:predicted aldo/keto reductase-like oxidoreductase